MQARNIFAGPYLDREAHLREDPGWWAAAIGDRRSRVVPVWSTRNLIAGGEPPRAAFLELEQLAPAARNEAELILLGNFAGRYVFTTELRGAEPPLLPDGMRFEDLRVVALQLDAEEAGLLSYARAMLHWRQAHRFCAVCGTPTEATRGGHVRRCTNMQCRHESFPRTDPAIIVLVSDGDRALLGRQASWPAGRYSTIAGFVEPGESLEDAVVREVFEETGVQVEDIEYHSSQPWPFPSSLMLGFTARARTTEIVLRDGELEDARWFSRDDVARGTPKVPPGLSISFRLIEQWFDALGGRRLRDLPGLTTWAAPPRQD